MNDITINHLTGNMGVTEKIKKAMYDAARQFVYIGFLLWEVKQYGYHNELNYDSVYSYAETELGFKKTSTKNFIAIAETFGSTKSINTCNGSITIGQDQHISMNINEPYEKFNYSQLTEMLSMSAAQREKITPDMTVKEIRTIKQQPKDPNQIIDENLDSINKKINGQTSDHKIDFKTLDKIISKSQESDRIITTGTNDLIAPTGPGHSESCKDRTDLHSIVINNLWCDISEDLLLKLIKASGLKKSKDLCYDITIKLHKDT